MRIYPNLTVDGEFKSLGDQGHMGTLNDRQFSFLRSKGYQNSLADMMTSWLACSPANLFSVGEQGVWFDPSDLTTLFQDTAGTTPVTTTGQSVGLMLDKSKGLVLGPELLADPTLENPSSWTASAVSLVVTGGNAVWTSAASGVNLQPSTGLTPVSGRWYYVEVTIASISAGALRLSNEAGTALSSDFTTAGKKTFYVLAPSTSNLSLRSVGTTTASVSDYSVKELPGNHAVQATTANRPIYGIHPFGGRRNLFTYTENMSLLTAPSTTARTNISVTDNVVANPLNGAIDADRITPAAGTLIHEFRLRSGAAQVQTYSFYLKPDGIRYIAATWSTATRNATFDLVAGTVIQPTVDVAGVSTIEMLSDGWVRIAFPRPNDDLRLTVVDTYAAYATASLSTCDGVAGFYMWGAQLETGSTATAYQRVTDQYNVTEAGVSSVSYLFFDGVNDSLATSTITPGVDKAQVFAGVRKLSDAAGGVVAELSVAAGGANPGSLAVYAPIVSGAATYSFRSSGTLAATTNAAAAAPTTNVLTGLGGIAGDSAIIRSNGTQASQSTADQGTGNYLAYPLYIGARAGTSQFFSGHLYGLIARFGPNLATGQISSTETWVAGKTGITI